MKLARTVALTGFVFACIGANASLPGAKPATITLQNSPFASLLKGAGFPLTMKPADLPADFVAAKITSDGGGGGSMGGIMDMIMSPMMMMMGAMGGSSGPGDEMMGALGALDLSWSRGEVASVDGQNFLVTYRTTLDMKDLAGMDKKDSFADAVLRLSLIRLDSIKSVTPRPDMTKEEFVKIMNTKFPKKPAKQAPTNSSGT